MIHLKYDRISIRIWLIFSEINFAIKSKEQHLFIIHLQNLKNEQRLLQIFWDVWQANTIAGTTRPPSWQLDNCLEQWCKKCPYRADNRLNLANPSNSQRYLEIPKSLLYQGLHLLRSTQDPLASTDSCPLPRSRNLHLPGYLLWPRTREITDAGGAV